MQELSRSWVFWRRYTDEKLHRMVISEPDSTKRAEGLSTSQMRQDLTVVAALTFASARHRASRINRLGNPEAPPFLCAFNNRLVRNRRGPIQIAAHADRPLNLAIKLVILLCIPVALQARYYMRALPPVPITIFPLRGIRLLASPVC